MKNILRILCVLGLLAASEVAHSQNPPPENYNLHLSENSWFRNWTYEELKSKIKKHQELIDLNLCNGRQTQLLPDLLKSNSIQNSLKILGTVDKKTYTYKDGSLYNAQGKLVSNSSVKDTFVKTTVTVLGQIRKISEGKRLLELMQQSLYSVTIVESAAPRFEMIGSSGVANFGFEETTAMQHFVVLRKSGDVRVPFAQFGAGGNVKYKPDFKMQNVESDGIKRDVPAAVILAHELFHAFDGVRGLMDRRFVEGHNLESIEVSEYRATYFENQIRKGLGRKFRKYYGDSSTSGSSKSLLDASGQPYLFPTPCF